jgi:hypothetical protein
MPLALKGPRGSTPANEAKTSSGDPVRGHPVHDVLRRVRHVHVAIRRDGDVVDERAAGQAVRVGAEELPGLPVVDEQLARDATSDEEEVLRGLDADGHRATVLAARQEHLGDLVPADHAAEHGAVGRARDVEVPAEGVDPLGEHVLAGQGVRRRARGALPALAAVPTVVPVGREGRASGEQGERGGGADERACGRSGHGATPGFSEGRGVTTLHPQPSCRDSSPSSQPRIRRCAIETGDGSWTVPSASASRTWRRDHHAADSSSSRSTTSGASAACAR